MSFEQRPNTGALFKADKQGNDNRPDYSGTLKVDDREFFIDAWLKKSKAGSTYMSLSIKPKMARHQGGEKNPPARTVNSDADLNNDIPW